MLDVRQETALDYAETARLASAAFDLPLAAFDPGRLRWLYNDAFHHGSTIFSLYAAEQKVGQVVLVHQRVLIEGVPRTAVALFDLFISKAYRSREAIGALYGAVERFCLAEKVRFIIGVPNESGARVNTRYLKLAPIRRLDLRAGCAWPRRDRTIVLSEPTTALDRLRALDTFARYLPPGGNGLEWTAETLWDRLSGGYSPLAVHATLDVLLVSTSRKTRGVAHTLLCGFFCKDSSRATRPAVKALTAAACLLHRRPLYAYAGCNDGVWLPGVTLPASMRPSPLTVQWRDFAAPDVPSVLERFELLDFDLA